MFCCITKKQSFELFHYNNITEHGLYMSLILLHLVISVTGSFNVSVYSSMPLIFVYDDDNISQYGVGVEGLGHSRSTASTQVLEFFSLTGNLVNYTHRRKKHFYRNNIKYVCLKSLT